MTQQNILCVYMYMHNVSGVKVKTFFFDFISGLRPL